jgi:pimeloyl-ACP methyl ester carboxylesterase
MNRTDSVFKSEEGKQKIQSHYREILKRWPVANRSYSVRAHGIGTHIIESGSRGDPPLLLFHGTSSNSASWMADVPLWSQHFRVLAVDLPGEPGLSEDRRLSVSDASYVDWIGEIFHELSIPNASLVGMSLGSYAALKFATREPQKVSKLVLITTGGIVPPKAGFIFKALLLLMLGKWGIKRLNRMIYYNTQVPPEVIDFATIVMQNFAPNTTEALSLFRDEEILNLTMPVLFFGGTKDALIDSEKTGRRLESLLPHAEVNILADTGHAILGKSEEILRFLVR